MSFKFHHFLMNYMLPNIILYILNIFSSLDSLKLDFKRKYVSKMCLNYNKKIYYNYNKKI